MEHVYTLKVRSYECDANGHVNNAEYLRYLEAARMEYLNAIGFGYDRMLDSGYAIFVSKIVIEYKAPALPNTILHIKTKPIKRRLTSGTFHQTILNDDTVVVDAQVSWVFVDSKGIPRRLPPELDHEEFYP